MEIVSVWQIIRIWEMEQIKYINLRDSEKNQYFQNITRKLNYENIILIKSQG